MKDHQIHFYQNYPNKIEMNNIHLVQKDGNELITEEQIDRENKELKCQVELLENKLLHLQLKQLESEKSLLISNIQSDSLNKKKLPLNNQHKRRNLIIDKITSMSKPLNNIPETFKNLNYLNNNTDSKKLNSESKTKYDPSSDFNQSLSPPLNQQSTQSDFNNSYKSIKKYVLNSFPSKSIKKEEELKTLEEIIKENLKQKNKNEIQIHHIDNDESLSIISKSSKESLEQGKKIKQLQINQLLPFLSRSSNSSHLNINNQLIQKFSKKILK